jgi:hypothetical protein
MKSRRRIVLLSGRLRVSNGSFAVLWVALSPACTSGGPYGSGVIVGGDAADASSSTGGALPDGGSGAPTDCSPNTYFCAGVDVHQCTASGKDSVVVDSVCQIDDLRAVSGVPLRCVACADPREPFACDSSTAVVAATEVMGTTSSTWRFPGGCANPTSHGFGRLLDDGSGFAHVSGSNPNLSVIVEVRPARSHSGPLFVRGSGDADVTVLGTSGTCSNANEPSDDPPPAGGAVTLRLDGTAPGSYYELTIDGYLWCEQSTFGPSFAWVPFHYEAHGVTS